MGTIQQYGLQLVILLIPLLVFFKCCGKTELQVGSFVLKSYIEQENILQGEHQIRTLDKNFRRKMFQNVCGEFFAGISNLFRFVTGQPGSNPVDNFPVPSCQWLPVKKRVAPKNGNGKVFFPFFVLLLVRWTENKVKVFTSLCQSNMKK